MTKSELITALHHQSHLGQRDVELAVGALLDHMSQALAHGERIEIRGFGSFSLNYHSPRTGRSPATGDEVVVQARYVPHFRPDKSTARAGKGNLGRRPSGFSASVPAPQTIS